MLFSLVYLGKGLAVIIKDVLLLLLSLCLFQHGLQLEHHMGGTCLELNSVPSELHEYHVLINQETNMICTSWILFVSPEVSFAKAEDRL